jgi:hypothetical protein
MIPYSDNHENRQHKMAICTGTAAAIKKIFKQTDRQNTRWAIIQTY